MTEINDTAKLTPLADWLDPRLVRRLTRPVERPGLVRVRQAYAIAAHIEGMLTPAPLAQRLERCLREAQMSQAGLPPIVYAQPRPMAPDAPPRVADTASAGGTPALPLPTVQGRIKAATT